MPGLTQPQTRPQTAEPFGGFAFRRDRGGHPGAGARGHPGAAAAGADGGVGPRSARAGGGRARGLPERDAGAPGAGPLRPGAARSRAGGACTAQGGGQPGRSRRPRRFAQRKRLACSPVSACLRTSGRRCGPVNRHRKRPPWRHEFTLPHDFFAVTSGSMVVLLSRPERRFSRGLPTRHQTGPTSTFISPANAHMRSARTSSGPWLTTMTGLTGPLSRLADRCGKMSNARWPFLP